MSGDQLAHAAAALVGVPYRLHGRDPAHGLDCVGVLAAALAAIGKPASLPGGYRLRTRHVHGLLPDPAAIGFAAAGGAAEPGDVALLRLSPVQCHLAIAAPTDGWIHAHAGLRRVVHQRTIAGAQIEHHWRLTGADRGLSGQWLHSSFPHSALLSAGRSAAPSALWQGARSMPRSLAAAPAKAHD